MIVCKFGGSSMADAAQIGKVKKIVQEDQRRRIVVVSAPGKRDRGDEKITDLLYKCNELSQRGESFKETFKVINERFIEIARDLNIDESMVQGELDEIKNKIGEGYGRDYASSRGEYMSALLMSRFMNWEMLDPFEYLTIRDDNTVDPASYDRLRGAIDSDKCYVVPGFYGRSETGEVKTFTRGGSDITGSVIARSVNAELYENWTDVSGVFRANPLLIPDSQVIDQLSYREVRALGEVGASVFHEEAILPVVEVSIPINIKNTNRSDERGTMILPTSSQCGVKGISTKGGYSRIYLSKLMLFKERGIRDDLLSTLSKFGIKVSYSWFGEDSIVWLFDSSMADDRALEELKERIREDYGLEEVEIDRGYAVLGLVGSGMDRDTSYIKVLDRLNREGIGIVAVSFGSSRYSAIIVVREEDKERALREAYDVLYR